MFFKDTKSQETLKMNPLLLTELYKSPGPKFGNYFKIPKRICRFVQLQPKYKH